VAHRSSLRLSSPVVRLFRVAHAADLVASPDAQARDAYFACLDDNGARRTVRSLRKAYERACPASWVKHFDAKRDEEIKLRKLLETRETKHGAKEE